MAEGGFSVPGKTIESSDQEFLHVCDCCQFEGTESEAVAFCVFCTDYLCDDCLRAHKKSRATREHEILEGDAIKEAKGMGTSILAVELCDHHKDKKVTLYCTSHDEVFCEMCHPVYHRKCRGVKSIEDASANESGDFKETGEFLETTRSLISDFKALETQKREALVEIAEKKTSCFQEIKRLRNDINTLLDQIEERMTKQIGLAVKKESETISTHLFSLENALKTLRAKAKDLEMATSCGQDKAFIALKRIQLPKLRELLQDIVKEKYQEDIEMTADLVQALQGSIHHLCQVKVHTVGFPIDDGKLIRDNVKDSKLKKVAQYNVNHPSDRRGCAITGCQVLPGGDFLLCDYNNSSLKILNLPMGLTSHIKLPREPLSVSLVSLEEAVVICRDSYRGDVELQFVSLNASLALGKMVKVPNIDELWLYRSVTYSKNQLYVACRRRSYMYSKDFAIVVLNLNGEIQSKVAANDDMQQCPPCSLVVQDYAGMIYTTYTQCEWVIKHKGIGEGLSKSLYESRKTWPIEQGNFLIDTEQNVYVCGGKSELQILSRDGQPYRTLLEEQKDAPTMRCMAYRSSDKTLLIGMAGNDVAVYRFV